MFFFNELALLWVLAGADGPGGAGDPCPESSHVQQQTEKLQAGNGEARERICKYFVEYLVMFIKH